MRIEEQDWAGREPHDRLHYTALLQEYRQAKRAWELRKKHIEQGISSRAFSTYFKDHYVYSDRVEQDRRALEELKMLQFTRSAQTACEAAPARAAEASEQLHTPDRHHVTDAETTQLHVQLLAELTARERRIEASTARPDSSTGYEHGHVTGSEKMDANLAAASSIRQEEAGAEASNKEKEQEDHEKIHPQQDERIREPPESWWGWQRLWLFGSGGQE